MADGLEGFLSQKIGPVPYWGIGLGVAGVIGVVIYRRQKAAPTAGQPGAQGAPGTGPYAPSPIVITPGGQNGQPGPPGPPGPPGGPPGGPPPPPPVAQAQATANGTVWLHSAPDATSSVVGILVAGQAVPTTGPPVKGASFTANYLPGSPTSDSWQPVQYAGATAYAFSLDVTVSGGGAGGGGSRVRTLPGAGKVGRFNSPRVPRQYVAGGFGAGPGGAWGPWGFGSPPPNQPRGSQATPGAAFIDPGFGGGAGAGRPQPSRALKATSQRSGVPLIRLMALNPHHWRPGSGRRSDAILMG